MADTVTHTGENAGVHTLSHSLGGSGKPLKYTVQVKERTPHGLMPVWVIAENNMTKPPQPVREAVEFMAPGHTHRLKGTDFALGRALMLFEEIKPPTR